MKKLFVLILVSLIMISCSPERKTEISHFDTGISINEWASMKTDVVNSQYVDFLNSALAENKIKIIDDRILAYYPGEDFDNYDHEVEITEGDVLLMPLNKNGQRINYNNGKFTVIKNYENHPVVMVTWFGSKAYADYYNYRLPSELEWEKAARGTDKRPFPTGNEISKYQANFHNSHKLLSQLFNTDIITTPVGFFNGTAYEDFQTENSISPFGLYDMAGNVWQWTGDNYHDTHLRYMRGGSQANYDYNLRVWARNNGYPDYYAINLGFRCIRDVN